MSLGIITEDYLLNNIQNISICDNFDKIYKRYATSCLWNFKNNHEITNSHDNYHTKDNVNVIIPWYIRSKLTNNHLTLIELYKEVQEYIVSRREYNLIYKINTYNYCNLLYSLQYYNVSIKRKGYNFIGKENQNKDRESFLLFSEYTKNGNIYICGEINLVLTKDIVCEFLNNLMKETKISKSHNGYYFSGNCKNEITMDILKDEIKKIKHLFIYTKEKYIISINYDFN